MPLERGGEVTDDGGQTIPTSCGSARPDVFEAALAPLDLGRNLRGFAEHLIEGSIPEPADNLVDKGDTRGGTLKAGEAREFLVLARSDQGGKLLAKRFPPDPNLAMKFGPTVVGRLASRRNLLPQVKTEAS